MKHIIGLLSCAAAFLSLLWVFDWNRTHQFWSAFWITSIFNLAGYVEGSIRTEIKMARGES